MTTPKIYKITTHTTLVVTAYDEEQAKKVAKKYCFVDGATQQTFEPELVTTVAQLPEGWNGRELAYSLTDFELYGQQSINHWLKTT